MWLSVWRLSGWSWNRQELRLSCGGTAGKPPGTTWAKLRLTTYNTEDCEALARTTQTIWNLGNQQAHPELKDEMEGQVVQVDALKNPFAGKWRVFSSPLKDLELDQQGCPLGIST